MSHNLTYEENELCCQGFEIKEIADIVGTPFFLYDHQKLIGNYQEFYRAFDELDPLICYAYKANSNLAVCRALTQAGGGADVVSYGELYKALLVGTPPNKIVFNGNGKTDEELSAGVEADILMFNIDSGEEAIRLNRIAEGLGKKVRIAFRVNPNIDARTHPYISTALKKSKFGIDISRAVEEYKKVQQLDNLEITGVHCHIGSQIMELSPFADTIDKMSNLVKDLRAEGMDIQYINLGGGLGIQYKGEKIADPSKLADIMLPILRELGCRPIFEPGRYIVGEMGILVAEVLYVKRTEVKTFVVLNVGMNALIRPALYQAYHKILPVTKREDSKVEKVEIVGPICESGDFLAQDRELPLPRPNDYLAILNAGAYGFSMASNYNAHPRPAEVMIIDGDIDIVRARETMTDLIAGEEIPPSLFEER